MRRGQDPWPSLSLMAGRFPWPGRPGGQVRGWGPQGGERRGGGGHLHVHSLLPSCSRVVQDRQRGPPPELQVWRGARLYCWQVFMQRSPGAVEGGCREPSGWAHTHGLFRSEPTLCPERGRSTWSDRGPSPLAQATASSAGLGLVHTSSQEPPGPSQLVSRSGWYPSPAFLHSLTHSGPPCRG